MAGRQFLHALKEVHCSASAVSEHVVMRSCRNCSFSASPCKLKDGEYTLSAGYVQKSAEL